jgi:hypothetical protein
LRIPGKISFDPPFSKGDDERKRKLFFVLPVVTPRSSGTPPEPCTLLRAEGPNTTTLFMVRLCGLADEITRPRAIASAEAEFFSC